MMNIIKNNIFYIIIFMLLIYKSVFINIMSNINLLIKENSSSYIIENQLLKNKIEELENNIEEITNLKEIKKENQLTKLSYRLSYSDNNFYITGDNYNINDYLVNKDGLVGMITKINKDYSEAILIKGISNLSVKIGTTYGTIKEYKDNYFIIDDISNYDEVMLNDIAYTTNNIKVGYVYKIEELDYKKIIYIKSYVDFNNLNYMYVVG